jgi:hypothetical protein
MFNRFVGFACLVRWIAAATPRAMAAGDDVPSGQDFETAGPEPAMLRTGCQPTPFLREMTTGYPDALRDVFTAGGPHEDTQPTEQQRKRFTVLYPKE